MQMRPLACPRWGAGLRVGRCLEFWWSGVTELSHRASSIFKFGPGVHPAAQVPPSPGPHDQPGSLLSLAARLVEQLERGHGAEHPAQVGEADRGNGKPKTVGKGRRPQEAEAGHGKEQSEACSGPDDPRARGRRAASCSAQLGHLSAVRPQGPTGAARVHRAGTPVDFQGHLWASEYTNTDLCAHRQAPGLTPSGNGRKGQRADWNWRDCRAASDSNKLVAQTLNSWWELPTPMGSEN